MSAKITELYKEAHQNISNAKAMLERDGELTDVDREQIDRWLNQAEEIEKRAKNLEAVLTKEIDLEKERSEAEVAKQQGKIQEKQGKAEFGSSAEYALAVYASRMGRKHDPRLDMLETKDLAGEVGASGGFLLPSVSQTNVLTARGENSIVRSRARVVPMGARVVPFPAVDYSRGAAGASAFYGGIVTYHVEENASITETNMYFREVELHAREIAGYIEVPNGLLRDSAISLDAFLGSGSAMGGALGWQEDYDFLRGNGVGKAVGALAAGAALSETRETASTFTWDDAVMMASKMVMGGRPVWLMNPSVMPKLYKMVDGATNAIWHPNVAGPGPGTLLGWPIIFTEKLPVVGTAGDVMLCDFSWYLVGDRQQVTFDIDRSFKFQNNQTAFRIVEAVDGKPWLNTYITLADGSTTVSPFVYLS